MTEMAGRFRSRVIFYALGLLTVGACVSGGPISTLQADSVFEVVPAPKEFVSPLDELAKISRRIDDFSSDEQGASSLAEMSWRQAWDTLDADQAAFEAELANTGEILLTPGHSYSFEIESYCVNGGVARPVTGDGLKMAALKGAAATWLPKILESQGRSRFPQERVQSLIWALLANVRYDELSSEQQALLRNFYPDAAVRFGNRRIENAGRDWIQSQLPADVQGAVGMAEDLRNDVIRLQSSYQQLEEVLAPPSDREQPIPVGWMKIPDGYLIRMTSNGYTRVRVDIFVPRDESAFGREPQSSKKRIFRPPTWVGLPAYGQRLALSNRAISRSSPSVEKECERARQWKSRDCRSMSDPERDNILAAADPVRFPSTWYESPPKVGAKIEDRTDCSHFVQEIYHRSGYDFPYKATSILSCLGVFREVQALEGRAGDLVLYRGHVGILTSRGNVISATRGGPDQQSTLKPGMDSAKRPGRSSIQELPKEQAGFGPWKILRWQCP